MSPLRITDEQGILTFYQAFSQSDFATMASMLANDCELAFPGRGFNNKVLGRQAIITLFKDIQASFAGSLTFHPHWAMYQGNTAQGDMVAAHWFTTGLLQGRPYINRGVAWYRLEQGLVKEFVDFFDTEVTAGFFLNDGSEQANAVRDQAMATIVALAPHAVQQAFAALS